ncbi:translation initiation factor IF-3 [Candidatus Nomurabacteria bacterium RIFCSPLOWO2_01_FULL_36_10b]|uniref:Translation initiation factor IF-3 n=1 Tax=Candidatus Nomurabacteria bacterium RIFCSPLOWO2_01_FULL_36_10b TaxID=1801766 RepID=A0A1F6WQ30_9BACT|nr:MAG: translation initiation factor IF-3 [Candidatus Nomurabacteria bacterium RIFCSPLOWO2_01_FULL_36_10b]
MNTKQEHNRTRINEGIRARELRIIDGEGGNLGVMSLEEALRQAKGRGLDLIEISPDANPPVAKIMDYGKFQYTQKKKDRDVRAKARASAVEVKEVQIKPGTGENDLMLKAKRASEWLSEGHRVKVDIFLRGREKYIDKQFHYDRLKRFLTYVTIGHTIVEDIMSVPKGFALIIEKKRGS